MLAAVATKGDLLLKNCITKHLESITAKIIEVGGNVEDHGDSIRVWCNKRPNKANIKLYLIQDFLLIYNHKWVLYYL